MSFDPKQAAEVFQKAKGVEAMMNEPDRAAELAEERAEGKWRRLRENLPPHGGAHRRVIHDFDCVDCREVDFTKFGSELTRGNFSNSDLRGADLRGFNLTAADFDGANLQGADLRGSHLAYTSFRRADLRGSDLREANFAEANLQDALLKGAALNWASHELIGAALLSEAETDEQIALALFVSYKRGWCWDDWKAFDHPEREWALDTLLGVWEPGPEDSVPEWAFEELGAELPDAEVLWEGGIRDAMHHVRVLRSGTLEERTSRGWEECSPERYREFARVFADIYL